MLPTLIHLSFTLPSELGSSIICYWLSGSLSYLLPHMLNFFLYGPVPALHCEILLVTHQHVGLYMVGDHMISVYWMEQNGLQHCFSSTYSEDSFTILYFSLPLVEYFCP